MKNLYQMFLDGSPLAKGQVDALLNAGLIEPDKRGGLVPRREKNTCSQTTIDELTGHC